MAEIDLYQRQRVPPSRVGAVKPPDIPDVGVGELLAGFAEDVLIKIETATAVNEESSFRGSVDLAIEEANTAVADDPGMSIDNIKSLGDQVLKNITAAAEAMTTSRSKRTAQNYLAGNKDLIQQKFFTRAAATKTKRERIQVDTELDRIVAKGVAGVAEADKLIDDQIGNLFSQEEADANKFAAFEQIERVQDEIDKAGEKVAAELKKQQLEELKVSIEINAFKIAEEKGYAAAEAMLRDPKTRAQLLDAGMSREDARSLLNDIEENTKYELTKKEDAAESDLIEKSFNEFVATGDPLKAYNIIAEDQTIPTKDKPAIENKVKSMIDHRTKENEALVKAKKDGMVQDIKPLLIDVIKEDGDKTEAYRLLNKKTAQLEKFGVLTKAEAVEANKVLGDWIDQYVAGRFRRAKDAEKLTTRQAYVEMMPKINEGSLIYEEIEQSNLLKDDKEKWYEYIKGSYKNPPTENTPDGHMVSVGVVFDTMTLQQSPTEAYDALLDARFNQGSITDDQFSWAVNKIENPYPEHLVGDIKSVLNSNLEDFNRFFSFDNERNKAVNEQLLAWVDKLIAEDKVPLFDFKKKMYAQSSQFRVGNDRWYDIGQVIKRGDREWEVIGFDENGEPIVEEVE